MSVDHGVMFASPRSLRPTLLERSLAFGSAILLVFVLAAIIRGHSHWRQASLLIWLHLATLLIAIALTPVLLLRPRGVRRHRQLGYAWVVAMILTSALSFGIQTINPGGFSAIHVLSTITMLATPTVAWHAHRHRVQAHRTTAISLIAAALLIAGFFTFPFSRMLGRWLFA